MITFDMTTINQTKINITKKLIKAASSIAYYKNKSYC